MWKAIGFLIGVTVFTSLGAFMPGWVFSFVFIGAVGFGMWNWWMRDTEEHRVVAGVRNWMQFTQKITYSEHAHKGDWDYSMISPFPDVDSPPDHYIQTNKVELYIFCDPNEHLKGLSVDIIFYFGNADPVTKTTRITLNNNSEFGPCYYISQVIPQGGRGLTAFEFVPQF